MINLGRCKLFFRSTVSISMVAAIFSGCAAGTVLGRPKAKDLDGLTVGTSRGLVLAELGAPSSSKEIAGEKTDVFAFDKGVTAGWKAGRAVFHIAADLFTICLWELVAWPSETIAKGVNTKMEVAYDKDEKIKTINYLTAK